MLSSAMVGFLTEGTCPLCGAQLLTIVPAEVPWATVETTPGPALAPFMPPDQQTLEFGPDRMPQCGRCQGIWPLTRSQEQELLGNLADESDAAVSDLRETRRFEDNVKTERRRYDNRRSSASSTHTLTVTYTIERAAVVESSRAFVVGGNASVKLPVAGSVAAKVDASIGKRYAVTDQATITMSDTLTVNVPARAAVDVILRWIRIWQEGEALVTEPSSDAQLVVPFRVPAALRLDTETVEV